MADKQLHRPTLRAIEVLQAAAGERNGLTLTELAERTKFPKSSLFPVAHTLAECGFLHFCGESGRYTLGIRAFETGQRYLEQVDLLQNVREELRAVAAGCSETCYFGVLRGGDVCYLAKVDSPQAIRMTAGVGTRLPAYATGIGKALLMDMDEAGLRETYPRGLAPLTENTITDLGKLYRELRAARASGLAYEKEESNPQIRCVASPIRQDGKIVCAVSVAVPVFRGDRKKMALAGRLLLQAKARLERLVEAVSPDFTRL